MCLNERRPVIPRNLASEISDGAEGEIHVVSVFFIMMFPTLTAHAE
jgi:hypothetical protein